MENKYEHMRKDDDQTINSIPATSHVSLHEKDQDSDNSDDVDDSTKGPIASDREKSTSLFEDSEDTPSKDHKDFEDARHESKKEARKDAYAPDTDS